MHESPCIICTLHITPSVLLVTKSFSNYMEYPLRRKRSLNDETIKNHTIKFYNAINDLNEDTLKNSSVTGTIKANKFKSEVFPKTLRRNLPKENKNKSVINELHIEPNVHQDYNHHSAENKIDSADEKKLDILDKSMLKILGNYTTDKKDTELSKLVANELKKGVEMIGAKNMTPVSNVTFTSENDTLTAMAFIAGNLLNKLWNMQKNENYGSIEADELKHEKINNLLDLFKEPLSIRQETFLKNALEKLSESLDKNKLEKNITICELVQNNISSGKNITTNCSKIIKGIDATKKKDQSLNMTTVALSKLNNVINLINDFERVQKDIDSKKVTHRVTNVTNDDLLPSDTFETFGNVLNKISKLLIPNHREKTKPSISNLNYLRDQNGVKVNNQNIHLTDFNMTVKDKIVLDYITHMKNNPSCLKEHKNNVRTRTNKGTFKVEGNILNFLSQFFNMKTFENLLNSLNLEIKKDNFKEEKKRLNLKEIITTTEKLLNTDKPKEVTLPQIEQSKHQTVKEKLKNHLKAIIDDLVELKTEDGDEIKKVDIAQALPCLFNILNDKSLVANIRNRTKVNSLNKIISLFNTIKQDYKNNRVTRRMFTHTMSTQPSQSAMVFERVIKTINEKLKQKTRRNFNPIKPKTYEQLIRMISLVRNIGNSYKQFALTSYISPKNRLMLLKALESDIKEHEKVLKSIQSSVDVISTLSQEKQKEIEKFVEYSQKNIHVSEKVFQNILKNKIPNKKPLVQEIKGAKNAYITTERNKLVNSIDLSPPREPPTLIDGKVTKDKIIKQLMINRINAYLQIKDATESDPKNDIKYNIALQILSKIKSGNTELAKELFDLFLSNEERELLGKSLNVFRDEVKSTTTPLVPGRRGALILALKDPLIAIQEKDPASSVQDSLLKQLMNLQSL